MLLKTPCLYFFAVLLLTLTSCKSIGPTQISKDRYRYNEVLQNTRKDELLTNIVRARYIEPFFFMKATSITTAYTLNPSISSGNTVVLSGNKISSTPPAVYTLGLTPGISYSDEPTITYAPVSNSTFLNSIYRPVELKNLHTLMFGGTKNSRLLLKLSLQYIVDSRIDNASEASSDEVTIVPIFKKFYAIVALFDRLQAMGGARLLPGSIGEDPTLVIHFQHTYTLHPLAIQMKKLLHVPVNYESIFLSTHPYRQKNVLQVETRSMRGIINYLSHGVRVPLTDRRDRLVNDFRHDGKMFDFSPLVGDLFTVYVCDTEPANVFAKTYFHNHWFYIKESDAISKLTFNYVNIMLILTGEQLGSESQQGPVLTLPART